MPEEQYSSKILTDAKSAATTAVTFGLETGQGPLDDAHTPTNAAFNTGALTLDAAPVDND